MASTTAMFTGLTGLSANSRWLDVTGNNVANVNTTAFKGSRMLFANAFSRTLSEGTPPNASSGGTNPKQIGFGTLVAGTQRDFGGGSISPTGDARDLAIEGDGFFIVRRGQQDYFTRAGAFRPNAENQLTSISGERLRGYGVDESFGIVQGELVDLTIPIGTLTLAQQTTEIRFAGNLNAAGDLPTQGSLISLDALSLLTGPVGSNALEATSLLTDIEDPSSAGNALFADGQAFQVSGATKGTKTIPAAALPITAASTVQDLMDFLAQALGINTTSGNNPDGRAPGVTLDESTGVITVVGNIGEVSDLDIDGADLRVLDSAGAIVRQPFSPVKTAEADGESVRTTTLAYDTRGNPISADITIVLEEHTDSGSTWRWFAESADDSDTDLVIGTGTLDFDVFGQPIGNSTGLMTVNRAGTGAADPLAITLDFNADSDGLTSLADVSSALAATYQDGSSLGTLAAFSFGDNGIITGSFTNGLTRTLGQVALATFSNNEGLVDQGNSLFLAGANSGSPSVTEPLQLGAGRLISGALELSNVDLSQEFINMILASTGYSASSRVITTTDQLMQQLLVLGR